MTGGVLLKCTLHCAESARVRSDDDAREPFPFCGTSRTALSSPRSRLLEDCDDISLASSSRPQCQHTRLAPSRATARDDRTLGWPLGRSLSTAPTLTVSQLSCGQARASAAGCDGISGGLLRAQPAVIAGCDYARRPKSSLTLIEPLQWKRGLYRDSIKPGQADPSKCATSRHVLASSQCGKAARRCLRAGLLPQQVQEAGETQFGGLPGRGTTRASLLVRLAQALAKKRRPTFAALSMVVTRAFYLVMRELVIRSSLDDGSIAAVVRAAGLPPSATHVLARRLRDHGTSLERPHVDLRAVRQVI